MSKRLPSNVAASVRQKLLNLARQRGEEFQFVLTRYAIERVLYRLGRSPHSDRFVLKGAMLSELLDLPSRSSPNCLHFSFRWRKIIERFGAASA